MFVRFILDSQMKRVKHLVEAIGDVRLNWIVRHRRNAFLAKVAKGSTQFRLDAIPRVRYES